MCSAPLGYGSIERQKNFSRAGSSCTSKARVSQRRSGRKRSLPQRNMGAKPGRQAPALTPTLSQRGEGDKRVALGGRGMHFGKPMSNDTLAETTNGYDDGLPI